MTLRQRLGLCALAFPLVLFACRERKNETPPAQAPPAATPPAAAPKEAEAKPASYTYPAPVKGHYQEVNVGSFDLVDGIAYPAAKGAGTVVYLTSKLIASPVLAGSPCPMTQARALTQLRNAQYVEVPVGVTGKASYFAAGNAFGGSSREQEVGGHYWSAKAKQDAGRLSGTIIYKPHGTIQFELPISTPKVAEVGQADFADGHRGAEGASAPTEQEVTAAYTAIRNAALQKDVRLLLAAQGFDAMQIASIRGLAGIDDDLAVYADRFLEPGAAGEFTAKGGVAYVRSEGANSKGKKFANYYWFAPCQSHLVLVSIAENPQ
ncbi:MAG TPA: hypothetical protein VKJ00_04500 [Thermoanaerobaculia bacterium]|nr:hypothetical protein [Thermoanaerobaculia bacterium]